MARSRKGLFWGLAVLAGLLLLAGLAVRLLLDPDRVRDRLVSAVSEQTGRELHIGQLVDLTLFPWLGVALREVRLSNAAGFGDEPLAAADELRVRVKVLPLLAGRLETDALVVRRLVLNLERNAKGEANWDDLRRPGAGAPDDAPDAAAPASSALAAFLIGGIELDGGRLVWRDQRASSRHVLDGVQLRTGAIAPGLAVPVRFAGRVRQGERDIALALAGTVRPDAGFESVQVADLSLDATSEGVALRLTGEVRGTRLAAGPRFEGHLDLHGVSPRALLAALGATPPMTADPSALGRLAARVPFEADAGAFASEGLVLTFDDTTLEGRLAVSDLTTGALRFDLAADRLDLDRYLPPRGSTQGQGAQPKAAGALVAGSAALPLELLRALDLDGSLRVGALRAGGARLTDARIQWRAQGGAINQTAEARLYGGRGRATSTLEVRRARPAMTLTGALHDVDLDGLLTDTAGQSRLTGKGSVEADLRWSGLTEPEIRRSLDGSARLALRDGAVKGFDIDGLVRNALAAVQGGGSGTVAQQTAFSELTASLTAQNGVLTNRDLKATSALLNLTGAGTVDLPANRIDYLARATLVESARGLLSGRLADLRDTPIPVRFTGNLDAPTIKLDIDEVLRTKAGQHIQRKVEEKLKGEWGDKLKKFLDR